MHEKQVKSILSAKNGMNIYRGCAHGCIYCDARSTCYQMDHAFEDIEIKANAADLLEQALRSKRKKCMIGTGAMSDPYLQIEQQRQLTRQCLELINQYGFGLAIQTKSDLILRDLDLLKSIHRKAKCVVQMTLTTYDEDLCREIEPNVCTTKRRAEVLNTLRDEGTPTIVWMTPLLPFINDTEENIRGILDYCVQAKVYGLLFFDIGVTLRDGDRQYFYRKLDEHFPGMKEKYIQTYGNAYEVPSLDRQRLTEVVKNECRKQGIICDTGQLFSYMHQFEDKQAGEQLSLFDL
jgi:DNA repair photolyase